ncbi:MAG: hypothetical protein IJT87_03020 [Ruminiclostridium sp.]|nr:hypothetical protein [Ruminiclostridium sp.]
MSSKPVKQKNDSTAPTLLPIFAAVALIISAAVYIVFKLTQQTAVNKWADYDECGI